MSKRVCIIVDIDDRAFEIMHGGATGLSLVKPTGENSPMVPGAIMVTYHANLTTESGRLFHADALGIMLFAEIQKAESNSNLLLGYSEHGEDHPDLFTTKE